MEALTPKRPITQRVTNGSSEESEKLFDVRFLSEAAELDRFIASIAFHLPMEEFSPGRLAAFRGFSLGDQAATAPHLWSLVLRRRRPLIQASKSDFR
jgi:hypothetical protein